MRIGLIDVDGHNFPNLALMRISAYYKSIGNTVEWWDGFEHYDAVYMSKIFSDAYTPDIPEPTNADEIIKGGTGYCITTDKDGIEHFDKSKDNDLPVEIERMFPDYSIYPQYDFAVAMTSRGCPRGCAFCHVAAKEGRCAVKVADVSDFWCGQPEIQVLDPNITACKDKRDLFRQYRETGAGIWFNQGLDIRSLNDDDIADLNTMRVSKIHFAWDNPTDELQGKFEYYAKHATRKPKGSFATVLILTNFENVSVEEHVERALHRIYTVAALNYNPYLMIYNKPSAPRVIREMQRWCNNKFIFKKVPRFEDYRRSRSLLLSGDNAKQVDGQESLF